MLLNVIKSVSIDSQKKLIRVDSDADQPGVLSHEGVEVLVVGQVPDPDVAWHGAGHEHGLAIVQAHALDGLVMGLAEEKKGQIFTRSLLSKEKQWTNRDKRLGIGYSQSCTFVLPGVGD